MKYISAILWLFIITACSTRPSEPSSVVPAVLVSPYAGSSKCQSCHEKAFKDWSTSDHFKAMLKASDSTVLGDFNESTFQADGVTSTFRKKDGKFFMQTKDIDGRIREDEILYTFGYHPLQQYVIALPGGKMQVTRASWDVQNKKWFHQYPGESFDPHNWLHWTGNGQNWNTMCASCHTTDFQKNYNPSTDQYQSTFGELGVTCESCHGPGRKHIANAEAGSVQHGDLWLTRGMNTQDQLASCAPCHARKSDVQVRIAGNEHLMDVMIPEIISDEFYFADGQIREEDFEYGSFTQSKMYQNDVKCSNCHNPHSGKLVMLGNALCMSCHNKNGKAYDSPEHHFHTMQTEGAQCVSCHMPGKNFMVKDFRRDHSFRVPRPDLSVQFGTPNACNACHADKSPQWAMQVVNKKFGSQRVPHFSDDLVPGSLLNENSESHLIRLASDTLQPEIARATAVYYLGNIQTATSGAGLINFAYDNHAMVRYQSIRSLGHFPPSLWQNPCYKLLSDKVRAVRIAAADLYHLIPTTSIDSKYRQAYELASAENKKFIHGQADFAVGRVALGDYYLQEGDQINAIVQYVKGLQKDSLMNYARFNLSAAYNAIGKNEEALKTLQDALEIDPNNDRTCYNLALLYYEMKMIDKSQAMFEKGISLHSADPGLYYNYGLLLQQSGNARQAEKIMLMGLRYEPNAENLHYALAVLYMQQQARKKAQVHAQALSRINPGNPQYQALFSDLGIR